MVNGNRESSTQKVLNIGKDFVREFTDKVAVEEPMEIRLVYPDSGGYSTEAGTTLMRTPGEDFELAAGFLYTEGVLDSYDAIADNNYCVGENGFCPTGCSSGWQFYKNPWELDETMEVKCVG